MKIEDRAVRVECNAHLEVGCRFRSQRIRRPPSKLVPHGDYVAGERVHNFMKLRIIIFLNTISNETNEFTCLASILYDCNKKSRCFR